MTDWRAALRHIDDDRMSPERAREIRRMVVTAARVAATPADRGMWRLAVVAIFVALLVGGGDRGSTPGVAPAPEIGSGERRQVQFSTPGGTRIIWEINPEFRLLETLP